MKKNLNLPKKKTGRLRNLFLTVCLLASVAASAQEKTVTGTVTDALGDPLIGATVLVQGTSNGVITDIDGRYSIQATPENTLDFSYVGMVKQAVKVGSQSVINVQMKDDSQMLAETVVIGYGSAKKRDLTGSITNIKGDEIANKAGGQPRIRTTRQDCRRAGDKLRQGRLRPGNPCTRNKTPSTATNLCMWWTDCSTTTSTS